MCAAQCWNEEIGQCLRCSPSVAEEISRAQAEAQRQQIWDKSREKDWTAELDLNTRAKVSCTSCGSKVDGGKFCSSCGSPLAVTTNCGGCGSTSNKPGAVFCSDCGTRL
jgi:DNA-directed RNA polymerase subunit RPC12/RpoP